MPGGKSVKDETAFIQGVNRYKLPFFQSVSIRLHPALTSAAARVQGVSLYKPPDSRLNRSGMTALRESHLTTANALIFVP
jgi:hypothetical protein